MNRSLPANPVSTPRILLVDDNQDGLIVRRSLLEEIGCCVEAAGNPEETLALLRNGHYDIVVTDYRRPGVDGVALIQAIRNSGYDVRVILLSGLVEPLGLTEKGTGA